MNITIKLNVGGKVFETFPNTLNRSQYFRSRLIDIINSDEPYFIDRSYELFEHVLNFLRDPNYRKSDLADYLYVAELDYYDVDGKAEYKEKAQSMEKRISNIETKLNDCVFHLKESRELCRNEGCNNKKWQIDNNNLKTAPYCDKCGYLEFVNQVKQLSEIKNGDILLYCKDEILSMENTQLLSVYAANSEHINCSPQKYHGLKCQEPKKDFTISAKDVAYLYYTKQKCRVKL